MNKYFMALKKALRILNRLRVRKEYAQTMKWGTISVCWVDVDGSVEGWELNADQEFDLLKVAQLISTSKQNKLMNILNGKEIKHGNKS